MLRFLFLICSLFLCSDAFAKRMAVLEFRSEEVESKLLRKLSDDVRAGVLGAVKGRRVNGQKIDLLTRENMLDVLRSMGKDASCMEGSCEVEIGRNIGADYIVTGEVNVFSGTYVLSLKLHETNRGTLLGADSVNSDSEMVLMSAAKKLGRSLTRQALGLSGSSNRRIKEGEINEEESDWLVDDSAKEVSVSFVSEPSGASVLLDGQMICSTTPCSRYIPAGDRDVRFELQRHEAVSKSFDASDGKRVSVVLKPRFGWFSFNSTPSNVAVYLDGKKIGVTPIKKREIDPGPHRLELKSKCHVDKGYRFQIFAGVHKTDIPRLQLKERLSAINVKAYIGSDGVSGDVYVDGQKLGKTASNIQVPLCSRRVEVRTSVGKNWSGPLSLTEKKVERIKAVVSQSKSALIYKNSIRVSSVDKEEKKENKEKKERNKKLWQGNTYIGGCAGSGYIEAEDVWSLGATSTCPGLGGNLDYVGEFYGVGGFSAFYLVNGFNARLYPFGRFFRFNAHAGLGLALFLPFYTTAGFGIDFPLESDFAFMRLEVARVWATDNPFRIDDFDYDMVQPLSFSLSFHFQPNKSKLFNPKKNKKRK